MRVFRSTDTFRMNEYPHNRDYIPFKFVSGLNVVSSYYQEEHDISNYLLYFDKNSRHLPEKLAENLPVYNHLYLWNIHDYWACEANEREDMMAFFYREGARLYLPYRSEWPYEHRVADWCSENNKWDEYDKLMERWQSGNARDC